jgi:hypothetical protein
MGNFLDRIPTSVMPPAAGARPIASQVEALFACRGSARYLERRRNCRFLVGTRPLGQRNRQRQNDAIALENVVCIFLRRAAAARFAAKSGAFQFGAHTRTDGPKRPPLSASNVNPRKRDSSLSP